MLSYLLWIQKDSSDLATPSALVRGNALGGINSKKIAKAGPLPGFQTYSMGKPRDHEQIRFTGLPISQHGSFQEHLTIIPKSSFLSPTLDCQLGRDLELHS